MHHLAVAHTFLCPEARGAAGDVPDILGRLKIGQAASYCKPVNLWSLRWPFGKDRAVSLSSLGVHVAAVHVAGHDTSPSWARPCSPMNAHHVQAGRPSTSLHNSTLPTRVD